MNKIATLLLSLVSLSAASQDYRDLQIMNIWSQSHNPAKIGLYGVDASMARGLARYEYGDRLTPNDAQKLWGAGIGTEGVKQFGSLALQGAFSYESKWMEGACGSMSTVPGYYPIDIYEFTPGKKELQDYSLSGGIDKALGENWEIGVLASYKSQNYSKRKDLRHTTYYMSMEVTPGILYHKDELRLGATYSFLRNTQSISAEELGISSGVYYAFLDKGAGFGNYDIWDNSSLHLKASGVSGFPIEENGHGLAFQLGWSDRIYGDVSASYHKGRNGEKQKIWFDFSGYELSSSIALRFGESYIRAEYSFRRKDNLENILEDVTQNGITITHNYGPLSVDSRQNNDVTLSWTTLSHKGFMINASATYGDEKELVSIKYPFLYSRHIQSAGARLSGRYDISRIRIGVECGFRKGWSDENEWKSSEIQTSDSPYRLEEYNNSIMAFRLGPSVVARAILRYTLPWGMYLEYNACYNSVKDLHRWGHTIGIGYNF